MTDKSNKGFTFDPEQEGAEVPTLTSLLYKKNLVKAEASPKSSPVKKQTAQALSLEPTQSGVSAPSPVMSDDERTMISGLLDKLHPQSKASLQSTPSTEGLSIEPATSVGLQEAIPVAFPFSPGQEAFTAPSATSSEPREMDPARRGLDVLRKRNLLRGAAVMKADGGIQRFSFAEQVDRADAESLWKGMSMDAGELSDFFSRLSKFGFIEFSPLAASGPANSDRMGFRTAFGLNAKEWLTLVRIGSSQSPEAILAVISTGSIQAHLPFFHAASPQQAAA